MARRSTAPYERVDYKNSEDYVQDIVDIFYAHLRDVKLSSALNIAYQKLDPETYEDLQEYLKDVLLSAHDELKQNKEDEALAPRHP